MGSHAARVLGSAAALSRGSGDRENAKIASNNNNARTPVDTTTKKKAAGGGGGGGGRGPPGRCASCVYLVLSAFSLNHFFATLLSPYPVLVPIIGLYGMIL